MAKFLAVNWRDLRNPEAGGAEVHLHEILKRLASGGHDVTLFSAGYPGGSAEDDYDGIHVMRRGSWYNANYSLAHQVRRHLARHNVDLVIEDINKIPFFLPMVTDTPVLAVIPHLFGTTVFRETNFLFASYVYLWERLIPRIYKKSRFAVISPSTRDDLVARGIDATRIDVVLCGLDHSTYKVDDSVQRLEHPTLIHFGRMRKYKSIDVVVKAFELIRKRLTDARLIIVGDGPERVPLERFVAERGLGSSVEFTGAIPTAELVRLLNQVHLFLNASPKEGWGLTVVEANACGLPVVASRRPGLQDSVLDGKTGYLVEYGDHEAFASKTIELLTDPDKWKAMSKAGLEWAQSLTWERTAHEMEEIFMKEIHRNGGPR